MSEAPTTLDAPAVSASSDLSDVQVAAMREQWVSLGLDVAAFDRAASGEVETAEPGEPSIAVLSDLKTPTLTEAEAQTMAAELLKAGVPREHVEAALKADGYALAQDDRTDDEKDFDRLFGAAPPDAYKIDFAGRVLPGMDANQLAGANAEFTAWLSAVGFPPEIGPAVVERALDVARHVQRMDEPARELWKREEAATFARMAGRSEDRARELAAFAEAALNRGGPAMRAALEKSGALDDAGVLMHLAHQGERLSFRGGS